MTAFGYALRRASMYYRHLGPVGCAITLRAAITKRHEHVSLTLRGTSHRVTLRVPSSDIDVYQQICVADEYDIMTNREPSVIVDGGANIGLASVRFATRFPGAQVFAIEPDEANYALLLHNTSRFENITPLCAALWHTPGEVQLVDPGAGHWGFRVADGTVKQSLHRPNMVATITMHDILRMANAMRIDVLKLDIEGAERELFHHSSSWISRIDCIICELHDRFQPGCSRSFFTATRGFDYEWVRGENVFVSRTDACVVPPPTDYVSIHS